MSFDKTFDGSDAHLLPADAAECVAFLRSYQEWRRWDGEMDEEGPAMPHPKSIGFAIDMAIRLIEERGELLAALERAEKAMEICSDWMTEIEMPDGWTTTTDEKIKISEAIANVKGGA